MTNNKPIITTEAVLAQVAKTLSHVGDLIQAIPSECNLRTTAEETDKAIKVKFVFNTFIYGHGKKPVAIKTDGGDYWFVLIKGEREEKLIAYAYDAYNYIMRTLYPHDLMFIDLPPKLLL